MAGCCRPCTTIFFLMLATFGGAACFVFPIFTIRPDSNSPANVYFLQKVCTNAASQWGATIFNPGDPCVNHEPYMCEEQKPVLQAGYYGSIVASSLFFIALILAFARACGASRTFGLWGAAFSYLGVLSACASVACLIWLIFFKCSFFGGQIDIAFKDIAGIGPGIGLIAEGGLSIFFGFIAAVLGTPCCCCCPDEDDASNAAAAAHVTFITYANYGGAAVSGTDTTTSGSNISMKEQVRDETQGGVGYEKFYSDNALTT